MVKTEHGLEKENRFNFTWCVHGRGLDNKCTKRKVDSSFTRLRGVCMAGA